MSDAHSAQEPTHLLDSFRLERILDQDPKQKSANLLGTLEHGDASQPQQAILILEKTHFSEASFSCIGRHTRGSDNGEASSEPPTKSAKLDKTHPEQHGLSASARGSLLESVANLGQNDIYTWLLAWLSPSSAPDGQRRDADVKLTLICPATQTHIDKYSAQRKLMVYETPQMYTDLVLPYIESIPPSRIQWVYNILEHKKEADTILYEDPDPEAGFILLPDLKWDQKTLSSLYLQAVVHNRKLRSLRDLKMEHVGMLRAIRDRATQVARDKYGLAGSEGKDGTLRCFIHYQPSYYHLHVHILASSYTSHPGSIVGQAHLLEDVIDLLELGVDFRQRTLGYALGENSKLWDVLRPGSL
ncbi:uncharacterized protein PFL1_02476 [Pseudozyma flocculosa PF-1]|uniref:m7GpppX diphosphatase n=2 Tax=Pseudozyma flocculosa TaxID=84751 RepID=A0A5C3EXU5_9BASI|nr:uncharacterized protein PFL1_02476 [Pseudozyma flocculosa PF-1]EPQ29803.1 hypothetical protein PFL1_02476 [Pseudozyma flocculosa PF-1]SPO37093.1 related to DCS1 - non-essential hydrolase involved in mRNA decapping [Pseudozyma flocculosa]